MTLKADSTLSGQAVELLVAGTALTVKPSTGNSGATGTTGSTGAGTTTTTTTGAIPTGPTTTTTTTIPSDVYTNTEPEPWNPFPCTPPGAPTLGGANDDDDAEGKGEEEGLGRLATLPNDPPALPFRRASPHPLASAVGQSVLEAQLADRAFGANSLGLGRIGLVLGDRVESLDVEAPAGLAPLLAATGWRSSETLPYGFQAG